MSTNLVDSLRKFLADNPSKHLNQFQKGQLVVQDLYYCTCCREILPLDQFEKDATKQTGIASVCKGCGDKASVSKYDPPANLSDEELVTWLNSQLDKAYNDGFQRVPRSLGNLVRTRYKGRVKYFSACKHFHLVRKQKGKKAA